MNKCSEITLPNLHHVWIDIQIKYGSVVPNVIYRHSIATLTVIDTFREELNEIFCTLKNSTETFFCLRDFNADLTQLSNNKAIGTYLNMLINFFCKYVIDLPTRIGTNSKTFDISYTVCTNKKRSSITSGVLKCDLSDHYSIFAFITNTKNQINNFNLDIFYENWMIKLSSFVRSNTFSINDNFEKVVKLMKDVID